MKSFNCKTNSEKRKPTARVAEITSVVWYSPYGNKASLLLLPSVLGWLFFVCRTFAFTCLLSLPNIDGPREYCCWTQATTECLKIKNGLGQRAMNTDCYYLMHILRTRPIIPNFSTNEHLQLVIHPL